MIKTVISDLGGVYFTDGTRIASQRFAEKYSLSEEAVYEVFDGDLGTQYREREIDYAEFFSAASKLLAIDATPEELLDAWLSAYEPLPESVALFKKIHENSNYRLLYLSDNVPERVAYLDKKYAFLEHFDDGVFSHVVGVRKPDPKIYTAALEKAQALPEECVFIDNKPQFLDEPKKMGMHVIAFTSPQQLTEELKKLGVEL